MIYRAATAFLFASVCGKCGAFTLTLPTLQTTAEKKVSRSCRSGSSTRDQVLLTKRRGAFGGLLFYETHDDNSINEVKRSSTSSDKAESIADDTCALGDEDCLEFQSLQDDSVSYDSGTIEDPLCDPSDVDCQAFLPRTYHNSDARLSAELSSRSETLRREMVLGNWISAKCPTRFVPVSSVDWVRRVAVDMWPIAVCGGARGHLYLVDLETKILLSTKEGAHATQVGNEDASSSTTIIAKQAMEHLYGKLDGGGVLSVAIRGNMIASAGREGGAKLWKVNDRKQIKPLGSLPDMHNSIVTSLKFDSEGRLYVGSYEGVVYTYDTSLSDSGKVELLFTTDFTDSVLDLELKEDLGVGVAATKDGGAGVFDLGDGRFYCGLITFDNVAARSVTFLKHKDEPNGYSIIVGGNDGSVHRLPLNVNTKTGQLNKEDPFLVGENVDTGKWLIRLLCDCLRPCTHPEQNSLAIKPKHTGTFKSSRMFSPHHRTHLIKLFGHRASYLHNSCRCRWDFCYWRTGWFTSDMVYHR
mmetsp:Transcript_19198/g.43311  ORF Transcript_19198/g.43311 Transcript_19198/m.43311 type:complete len:526 (+) Transcript_19198:76-1653(+)